ncbi:MAG: hypothetical protein GXO46_02030, partial [Chlorobi bacterium]|nr:hypothetical protein [Chlorobiota bacterium]
MKVREVAQQISEGVLESINKYGFKYRKAQKEFVRKKDNVEQIFKLFFYKKGNFITIDPEIKIHIEEIESIYKSIAKIESRPYLTLGNHFLKIRDYNGDDANYKSRSTKEWLIESEKDIENLVKIIPKYFKELILPYFENNSTIKRVDELLNENPRNISVYNEM